MPEYKFDLTVYIEGKDQYEAVEDLIEKIKETFPEAAFFNDYIWKLERTYGWAEIKEEWVEVDL